MKCAVIMLPLLVAGCMETSHAVIQYPHEECGYVEKPVYGVLHRQASPTEVAGGAIIGGALANAASNGNAGATIVGALVGAELASKPQRQPVIVNYRQEYICKTVYR